MYSQVRRGQRVGKSPAEWRQTSCQRGGSGWDTNPSFLQPRAVQDTPQFIRGEPCLIGRHTQHPRRESMVMGAPGRIGRTGACVVSVLLWKSIEAFNFPLSTPPCGGPGSCVAPRALGAGLMTARRMRAPVSLALMTDSEVDQDMTVATLLKEKERLLAEQEVLLKKKRVLSRVRGGAAPAVVAAQSTDKVGCIATRPLLSAHRGEGGHPCSHPQAMSFVGCVGRDRSVFSQQYLLCLRSTNLAHLACPSSGWRGEHEGGGAAV
jgi:hypothetical protein